MRTAFAFAFLLGISMSLGFAEESVEARINRGTYPIERYSTDFEVLPPSLTEEIREKLEQALAPIRLAPASWFRSTFGTTPNATDRKRILSAIAEVEIWKCRGSSCKGCPGHETLGCALGKKGMGGVGVMAAVHACLVGEGKCPRGEKPDSAAWTERVIASIAFHKGGFANGSINLRKVQQASSDWIAATAKSVNRLLGACPGPYSLDSMKFLLTLEAVSIPNPAVRRCGRKYLEALRTLPRTCASLRTALKEDWAQFEKETLTASPDVLRCDAHCRKFLCRSNAAKTIFVKFASKSTLLLADGACEGEAPLDLPTFLMDTVPRSLRSRLVAQGCLVPMKSAVSEESTSDLSSGNEVQLVE